EGTVYLAVGEDGQITHISASLGTEGESLGKTLKELRKAIEDATKEAKTEGDAKLPDKPDEKVPVIAVKVEADAEGDIKTITMEAGGKSTKLANVPAYRDALKAQAPKDANAPEPRLTLVLDGRLKQRFAVQFIDTGIRCGVTDIYPK